MAGCGPSARARESSPPAPSGSRSRPSRCRWCTGWLLGAQHRAKLKLAPEGGVVALPDEGVGDSGPVLRLQLGVVGPVVLGDVPLDFLRADRGADELVNRVAQLEGALGDPGDGPGQDGPLRPQPGVSDHVEHLFLGAVDDDLGLDTSHDRPPFDLDAMCLRSVSSSAITAVPLAGLPGPCRRIPGRRMADGGSLEEDESAAPDSRVKYVPDDLARPASAARAGRKGFAALRLSPCWR